ncbi:unnamed protein product [Somion occarium]|uniref:Uncharacterized protein n=1 Tax=Somion occarium TaxID=3059160 RepID=A0ABP1D7N4_9APHY
MVVYTHQHTVLPEALPSNPSATRSTRFSLSCALPGFCISPSAGSSTSCLSSSYNVCSSCDLLQSSTPHYPSWGNFSRDYPSPPLTGNALKHSVSLPDIDGGASSLADPLSLIHHDSGRPLWQQPNGFEDAMDLDPLPLTPPSPHSDAFCLPPPQPSSIQASGVCSSLENHGFFPSSPSRRYHSSLPDFDSPDLGFMTPVPHSPRGPYLTLPDLEMADERFPPSSPLSPQIDLPSFPGSEAFDQPVTTISPSLLGPPPPSEEEGLGLFVRPSAVEPPLARSPSPDQDDFRFLDVQLDPLSSNLDNDEFLQLRALRNRALDAERAARLREEYLAERVESASHALLPSVLEEDGVLDDPQEKRARKHDLHVAMDLRAEARKARKREKQRSKEIGLLLELKMCEGGFSMLGFGDGPGDAKHLVASMVMKRRDTSRPLANRKAASSVRSSSKTSLSRSVSHEDLSEALMDIE